MIEQTLFPVTEVPAIQYPSPSDELNQEEYKNTGYKFIVREDTGKVLSCMTDDYKLVDNREIIKTAEPILKQLVLVMVNKQLGNGYYQMLK